MSITTAATIAFVCLFLGVFTLVVPTIYASDRILQEIIKRVKERKDH